MIDFYCFNESFSKIANQFIDFIENFHIEGNYIYLKKYRFMMNVKNGNHYGELKNNRMIEINLEHIIAFDEINRKYEKGLYECISIYPVDCVSIFEYALDKEERIQVKLYFDGINSINVSQIDSTIIGSLVKIVGHVVSVGNPKIIPRKYNIKCKECKWEKELYQKISISPLRIFKCPNRNCKAGSVEVDVNSAQFLNYYIIKVQDSFQVRKNLEGGVPRSISVFVDGNQGEYIKCGDKISIFGSVLVGTTSLIMEKSLITSGFVKYIKAFSVFKEKDIYKKKDCEEFSSINKFREMALSIAPNVLGHEYLKRALLCQLVSGNIKKNEVETRGSIHILVIGDPSTGKSQIMKFMDHLSPIYTYSCGRTSSGVGLTASLVKDYETNEYRITYGSLALASGGIACIDEFNNTSDGDRASILEVLEQQTISINKGGVNSVITAKVSVLACCNTITGKIINESIFDQINLRSNLLSRFDFCFLLRDEKKYSTDFEMALFVMGVHSNKKNNFSKYSVNDILEHVENAKKYVPLINKQAAERLENFYCNERSENRRENSRYNRVTVRQLEGIIRASEAIAKLCFSLEVNVEHVEEAISIYRESTYDMLYNSRGKLNNYDNPTFYRESIEVEEYIRLKYFSGRQWRWGHIVQEMWKTIFRKEAFDIAITRMVAEKKIEFSEDGDRVWFYPNKKNN